MTSTALPLVTVAAPPRRWIVVALAVSGVLLLAHASLVAGTRAPWLGVVANPGQDALVVRWVQPGGWAWDSGVRPGYTLVSVDGQQVDAAADPEMIASASRVQVRDSTGALVNAPLDDASVPDSDLMRWVFLSTAACFLLVGGAIYVLANDRLPAALMLANATSGAVLLTASLGTPSGLGWALATVYVALVGFGLSIVLLCLVFPIDRLASPRGRRRVALTAGVHIALIAGYVYVIVADSAAYDVVRNTCLVVLTGDLVAAVVLIVVGVRATPADRRARRQALTLVALGMIAGCLPLCLLSMLPHALGLGAIVPPQFAVLSMVLAPASFGVGILSRQFFGIERIVRRGLVALVVWMTLLGTYVMGLALLGAAVANRVDAILLAVVVTAGSFPYLQSKARARLEHALFRDTYVYAEALQLIGQEIVTQRGVEAIAGHVLDRLGRMLDLTWAALAFDAAGARYTWGANSERAASVLVEPLIADGERIGSLSVGPKQQDIELLHRDRALIATLAPLVATALQSASRERDLEQQVLLLHHREQELEALSDRLMRVQEDDRHHLALDLHDDPLQRAILLAREMGEEADDARATRWRRATDEIIASLRAICTGLRPRVLDDLGLKAGLTWLVNDLRAGSELDVSLSVSAADGQPFGRLSPDLEIALFRVVQEALANCLRHAEARTVSVDVVRDGSTVRLVVDDDGVGLPSHPVANHTTLGVLGMRERLRAWGGTVRLESLEPRGTRVVAEVG